MKNVEEAAIPDLSPNPESRPDQTVMITRGVVRLFIDMGWSPLVEFKLANGRRADVAGLDRKGRLIIAEVKSCRADFEVDQKWPEYKDYCDQFFFAVEPSFPLALLPEEEGLILADGFGAMIKRPAIEDGLVAARRKAVTLRFARQAARRAIMDAS
ncbi:MAG: hypothetical protein DHS20C05_00600 [Hyphococcus sp.]|nr:MAG: hypothetical protein DHS20C05_00600 [Marinicaulis sp.]